MTTTRATAPTTTVIPPTWAPAPLLQQQPGPFQRHPRRDPARTSPPVTLAAANQRSGSQTGAGHSFGQVRVHQVSSRTAGTPQAQLTVSQPGDSHEQEADQVADRVMRMPGPSVLRQPLEEEEEMLQPKALGRALLRQPMEEEEEMLQPKAGGSPFPAVTPGVAAQVDAARGTGGRALDGATRSFMEQRFGHEFSAVRVHTDPRAAESARAVQARAYTLGRDIVFGPGEYHPETDRGRRLLAHELTHVVQQGIR